MAAEPQERAGERADLDAYDYALPPECIAQRPAAARDGARLLHLDRRTGATRHGWVRELPDALAAGDLLVVNATRVLPARLRGAKESGGRAQALLLEGPVAPRCYRALVKARGRLRVGQKLRFTRDARHLDAEIHALAPDGVALLCFADDTTPYALGETPLPPYIARDAARDDDAQRYQTVYARVPGSVAAPTAGLHLSESLLAELAARGISRAEVVLHVGPGTFRPLAAAQLTSGRLHPEAFWLPDETAEAIARTRAQGGRVVAVGTTTTRVLEACARDAGRVAPGHGTTDLFLRPGHAFRVVDALLTNFHLPRSSLLLLVAAFATRDAVLAAYAEAIACGYRFYSYGDAMLIQ